MGSSASVNVPPEVADKILKSLFTYEDCSNNGGVKTPTTARMPMLNSVDDFEIAPTFGEDQDCNIENSAHVDFFSSVKLNTISTEEAKIYIQKYPDSLFAIDNDAQTAIEHAGSNGNTELFCILMKYKIKHLRRPFTY